MHVARFVQILSTAALFALPTATLVADDVPMVVAVPFEQLQLRIVDEAGQPVAGAKVTPWALGSNIGHGRWSAEDFGKPREVVSDETGQAVVDYPKFHDEQIPVMTVSVMVDHPDYCWVNEHLEVNGALRVELKRGTKLKVATYAEKSDVRLQNCTLLFSGEWSLPRQNQQHADGWISTRPIAGEQGSVRVVHFPEGGPTQFSPPFQWKRREGNVPEIVLLTVKPGVKVRGRLSDKVPRPVKRGQVSVIVTQVDQVDEPWSVWNEYTEIAPDGSFEFASLPPAADLQLIALCEGFISAKPAAERFNALCDRYHAEWAKNGGYDAYPSVVTPDSNDVEIELDMVPTFDVEVRVRQQDGRPVAGLRLGVNPNQYYFGYGSQIVGDCYRTVDLLDGFDPTKKFTNFPYDGISDEEGKVVIRNLVVCNAQLGAWPHEEWELPVNGSDRSINLRLIPGMDPIEVVVVPQGTEIRDK